MITQPTYPLLPDHTQLPESDGTSVQNFQAHPQSVLLAGHERVERAEQRAILAEQLRRRGIDPEAP